MQEQPRRYCCHWLAEGVAGPPSPGAVNEHDGDESGRHVDGAHDDRDLQRRVLRAVQDPARHRCRVQGEAQASDENSTEMDTPQDGMPYAVRRHVDQQGGVCGPLVRLQGGLKSGEPGEC